MLRFNIFGIPVTVEPWFWLMAFLLGGGLNKIDSRDGIVLLAVWGVIVFVSVLVHELGHAIIGRKYGGGAAHIRLWGLGGLAYNKGGRFTQKGRALMIAAGPGFGFILLGIGAIIAIALFGPKVALDLLKVSTIGLLGIVEDVSPEFMGFFGDAANKMKFYIFFYLFQVNFFWGLLNLLPVSPLDGGQLFDTFSKSPKRTHLVGMITGAAMAVGGAAFFGSFFMAIMFGFLAFQNYQAYEQARY